MKCDKCGYPAPENLASLSGKWLCDNCDLLSALLKEYKTVGKNTIYVSREESNLSRVRDYLEKNIDTTKDHGLFTLCFPSALSQVPFKFDTIYCDLNAEKALVLQLLLKENGCIKYIPSDIFSL